MSLLFLTALRGISKMEKLNRKNIQIITALFFREKDAEKFCKLKDNKIGWVIKPILIYHKIQFFAVMRGY